MIIPKLKNHPDITGSIETGYRVMEQLRENKEPLDQEMLLEFLSFGSDRLKNLLDKLDESELTDEEENELNEIRHTFPNALEVLGELERCSYPIPREIAAHVCRCSRSSLFHYDKQISTTLTQKLYAEIEKAECTDLL